MDFDCCSICLDTYKDPYYTECGHVYCKICISNWVLKSKKYHAKCPVCRCKISIDEVDSEIIKEDNADRSRNMDNSEIVDLMNYVVHIPSEYIHNPNYSIYAHIPNNSVEVYELDKYNPLLDLLLFMIHSLPGLTLLFLFLRSGPIYINIWN